MPVATFGASRDEGGVVSAGGVGFDISCGVRLLTTGLTRDDGATQPEPFAHELSRTIPAGVGSRVEVAERVGLARRVARLAPMICIKG